MFVHREIPRLSSAAFNGGNKFPIFQSRDAAVCICVGGRQRLLRSNVQLKCISWFLIDFLHLIHHPAKRNEPTSDSQCCGFLFTFVVHQLSVQSIARALHFQLISLRVAVTLDCRPSIRLSDGGELWPGKIE